MSPKSLAAVLAVSAFAALGFSASLTPEKPKDTRADIYFTDGSHWVEAPVEMVSWKDGSTAADLNGRIDGTGSSMELPRLTRELSVLIHATEGVSGADYRLVKLHAHRDSRELHVKQKDPLFLKVDPVAPKLWKADISGLQEGEYGFLVPADATGQSSVGQIYSFHLGNCDHCAFPAARPDEGLGHQIKRIFSDKQPSFFDF